VVRLQEIKSLADQFICVRLIKCNSLDLQLFQFDYDLTFAAFFLSADKTIIARYGTRNSHDSAEQDVSIKGLAATMASVLKLHKDFDNKKKWVVGKQPGKFRVDVPENFSKLSRFDSELTYEKEVSKSCIHCHQIRDAYREDYRDRNLPVPDKVMYPNPTPLLLGLRFETDSRATVAKVTTNSLAQKSGIKAGDLVQTLNGQAICSTADVQWVLHNQGKTGALDFVIKRPTTLKDTFAKINAKIALDEGWRAKSDISWRTSTWDLRRIVGGGMYLENISDSKRKQLKIPEDKMALNVRSVGKYGQHAVAMRAGIRKGDILVRFNERTDLMSETEVIAYGMQNAKKNQMVTLEFIRNGKPITIKYKLQ